MNLKIILGLQQSEPTDFLTSVMDFLDHGAVGILSGVFLTLSLSLIARKRRIPIYSAKSRRIFIEGEQKIENLEVVYKGVPVRNLTITDIAFFNAGRSIIRRKDDIPEAAAITLKVCTPDVEIIGQPVITFVTNEFSKLAIVQSAVPNNYVIEFDYLAYNDGAIIKVAHTGNSSSDLVVEGVVHESEKIKRIDRYYSISDRIEGWAYSLLVGAVLPLVAFFILATLVRNLLLGLLLLVITSYLAIFCLYVYWTPKKWKRITRDPKYSYLEKIIPNSFSRFRLPDTRNLSRHLHRKS